MGSFYSSLGAFTALSVFRLATVHNFDSVSFILTTGYVGLTNRLLSRSRLKEQLHITDKTENKINDFLSGALSICETISVLYFYDKIFL